MERPKLAARVSGLVACERMMEVSRDDLGYALKTRLGLTATNGQLCHARIECRAFNHWHDEGNLNRQFRTISIRLESATKPN